MNQHYYGDNLNVLRDHIASESVDLIYLAPPFNSKRDYNLLIKSPVRGKAGRAGSPLPAAPDTDATKSSAGAHGVTRPTKLEFEIHGTPKDLDAASAGFYESPNGKKFPRVQLLTIGDLLEGEARAEHPDYEPDLNFKQAKQEEIGKQKELR